MYHRKEKKSDFSQVHEAAAKLSGSPSAPYVLSAELGWGLWLQISSLGAARSMEGMLGIPPVSLCSHQGGGTGEWQWDCSSRGAARTGACSGDKHAAPPCRLTAFPGHRGGSIRKIRVNYQVMLVQKEWRKRAGFLLFCSTIPFAWDFWVGALFSSPQNLQGCSLGRKEGVWLVLLLKIRPIFFCVIMQLMTGSSLSRPEWDWEIAAIPPALTTTRGNQV